MVGVAFGCGDGVAAFAVMPVAALAIQEAATNDITQR
jgi:hypothetical protein